ncbi:MAG: ribosome biogenesis GTP-binding protein YihA/YsxC [Rhodospirillales bacterium]
MTTPDEPADAPAVPAALPDHDADTVERGRLLFAGACDFVLGAAQLDQIPETELPEIAFAGRSNVGKSSLINALMGRKALARTSNTPGRTQEINFFNLGGRLMVADLPGYGYARAPKSRVENWTRLVNSYLKGRQQLRRVCLLIDARHGLKANDRDVMKMLDSAAVAYQAVLTKADKVSASSARSTVAAIEALQKTHTALHPRVIPTSARDGDGIEQLRAELVLLAE